METIMTYNILVTAPQHSSKMYAWEDYSKRLRELSYPNIDFYFVDNSEDENNAEIIREAGFKCDFLPTGRTESVFSKIARSHEKCRQYFLNGDYDYMLHLETDVIPPIDVIERLLQKSRPVISATYETGVGFDRKAMIQPLTRYEHKNIKAHKDIDYLNEIEPVFMDGTTKQAFAFGLGCVLIHKSYADLVPFRNDDNILASADTFWANDMYASNVPLFVATDVYCEHLNESWHLKEI